MKAPPPSHGAKGFLSIIFSFLKSMPLIVFRHKREEAGEWLASSLSVGQGQGCHLHGGCRCTAHTPIHNSIKCSNC